ncbi:MAG: hypothetical protein ACR2RV_21935, partial [Verrucomicrobiales bacterium]
MPRILLLLASALIALGRAAEAAPLEVGESELIGDGIGVVDWQSGEAVGFSKIARGKYYGIWNPPGIAEPGQSMVLLALGGKRIFSNFEAVSTLRELDAAGANQVEILYCRERAIYRSLLSLAEVSGLASIKEVEGGFEPRRMTPMLSSYAAARELPALDTLPPRAAFEIEIWLGENGRPIRGVGWLDGFLDQFTLVTSLRYAESKLPPESPLAFINQLAANYQEVASTGRQPQTIDDLPTTGLAKFFALYPYPRMRRFPLGELDFGDRAFARALRLMTEGEHLVLANEGISDVFPPPLGRDADGGDYLRKFKRSLLDSGRPTNQISYSAWKRKGNAVPEPPALGAAMPSGERALALACRCPLYVLGGQDQLLSESLTELWALSPWLAVKAWMGSVKALGSFKDKQTTIMGIALEEFASEHLYQPENRFITFLNRHAFFLAHQRQGHVTSLRLPPVFAPRPEFQIYSVRPGAFLNAGWL